MNRKEKPRAVALAALREYVLEQYHELSTEKFTQEFMNDLIKRISELVRSPETEAKMGGILAIDELIDIASERSVSAMTRFANYLRTALPHSDTAIMVAAAKALGHLVRAGGNVTSDVVEFEVKRALEWLTPSSSESKKLAAVLVLSELAQNAPTLFYAHVTPFFDAIWVGLRDSKDHIREASVTALRAVLSLIANRESALRFTWYHKIWKDATAAAKGNSDAVHGSLLAVGELLRNTTEFMGSHFKDSCALVLKYKDHKLVAIRKTVIQTLPLLAAFSPNEFVRTHLNPTMTHLLSALNKNDLKPVALIAVGELASAVGDAMKSHITSVLPFIQAGLNPRVGKSGTTVVPEALRCIEMLAEAVGPHLEQAAGMRSLLDQMFASGLSPNLTSALATLAKHLPELLPVIQDKLLHILSTVLSGAPYRPPGTPAPPKGYSSSISSRSTTASIPRSGSARNLAAGIMGSALSVATGALSFGRGGSASISSESEKSSMDGKNDDGYSGWYARGKASTDTSLITLALSTLGSFDFSNHSLTEFVQEVVLDYVDDESDMIRKEAALTCATLIVPRGEDAPMRGVAAAVVSTVLEKLLTVAIADPVAGIRYAVLESFDARFDRHLAQADNLRSLFIALNDEVFEIRELAIHVIGRLTTRNPAYVMPSLRKTLIQLLTELEFSGDSRNKEESARLLGHLIAASDQLMKPYVEPVLSALMPKLTENSHGVVTRVLGAVGELAHVGGRDLMMRYMDDLVPMIMETLSEQASVTKRQVALHTLGQLVESTGYVIKPYEKYPTLLPLMLTALKTESSWAVRREIIKDIGILGSLDPYRHKVIQLALESKREIQGTNPAEESGSGESDALTVPTVGLGGVNDEYYTSVAIAKLMAIFRDPALGDHHTMVVQAVMYIFKSMGMKCVPYLARVMPPFLSVMRTCEPLFRDYMFLELRELVSIVKAHIRPFLLDLFALVQEFWGSGLQLRIIGLVEEISVALGDEFKTYLPSLIRQLLAVLHTDKSERRTSTHKVLHALDVIGSNLDDYLHLVIPAVVKLFEAVDAPVSVRVAAITTLGRLSKKLTFSDYASRIIHPLARVLAVPHQELRKEAMETLCALVFQLGPDYAIFIQMINKVMAQQKIHNVRYATLVTKLLKNEPLQWAVDGADARDGGGHSGDEDESHASSAPPVKLAVNQHHLKKAWEAPRGSTKDDWVEWMRRFSVELLRESPSPALRSCHPLAQIYHPLARELFQAGFSSCWAELYDTYRENLVHALETALSSPSIPAEILQILLGLAEFMEHDDKALPIDSSKLGRLAESCHAYAKALHYKEAEFVKRPDSGVIEELISINNQLQQPEAAVGILLYAQKHYQVELKESWYEKLQRWDDALVAYELRAKEDPTALVPMFGRMRCLKALGEWERLFKLSQEVWRSAEVSTRRTVATLAASAAWNLGKWKMMSEFVNSIEPHTMDGSFYRAILSIHRDDFTAARKYIEDTRQLLDSDLTAAVGESYGRAYSTVVRVQQLTELEEVIEYKAGGVGVRERIRRTWDERLAGCQRDVNVWQSVLGVRSLVIPASEDMGTWLEFATLCQTSKRGPLGRRVIGRLLGLTDKKGAPATAAPPQLPEQLARGSGTVQYAYLKYLWEAGQKDIALSQMKTFVKGKWEPALLAKGHMVLGNWAFEGGAPKSESAMRGIIASFAAATTHAPDSYNAWHRWAFANFVAVQQRGRKPDAATLVAAIQGFFKSISLATENHIQDTLRILTLWFKYGDRREVEAAMIEGFATVSIDTWLAVIPQLIARIQTQSPRIRKLIAELLTNVGRAHPQALVFPLTVASKTGGTDDNANAAVAVLEDLKKHNKALVDAAQLVSTELIRVAILWHERWHEGLEEASRLYFGDKNIEGMFSVLTPLHNALEAGPVTMREVSFQQAYGRDLAEAWEWCKKYMRSNRISDLNQAWDLYYHVFRRINKELPQLTTLELAYVSDALENANDLELAVPGTYVPAEPVIPIAGFVPTLKVITSKQRPRQLRVRGGDGREYVFLLKGHEDTRQDERVMQLFGLINTLLANDPETSKSHLSITRYAVIPLSPNSGLIGWLPSSDTLHALIREYREARKVMLNVEHRLTIQMAPDFDHLSLIQKVEVFEYALENTDGQDLYKVMWLKSANSEVWLERRTNYTRSLAVMSMAGYILGLGDRHPSNLMLHRVTGRIAHIDFGDCFEVAQHREKFPEKVPFRLTRMLIKAMEVSGVEGTYKTTCRATMRVLRDNKDSLLAVLDAFVHDPLLNWRLLGGEAEGGGAGAGAGTNNGPDAGLEGLLDGSPLNAGSMAGSVRNSIVEGGRSYVGPDGKEVLNKRAVEVMERVKAKLTGRDFDAAAEPLGIDEQINRLILQATNPENLARLFVGYCSWW